MNNLTEKRNIHLATRWFDEVWNQGLLESVDELMAENVMAYDLSGTGNHLTGTENFKHFVQSFRTAFPDLKITIMDVIADEEKIAMRWEANATHTGNGIFGAPTHAAISLTGMSFANFCNEKVVEAWNNWDIFTLMKQIGALNAAIPGNQ